jgi:hypothetical protein
MHGVLSNRVSELKNALSSATIAYISPDQSEMRMITDVYRILCHVGPNLQAPAQTTRRYGPWRC